MRSFLKQNDLMAYLTKMAVRLRASHRVLKPRGWLCRRCDPTASHYLKVLLDAVFGTTQFQNDVRWQRAHAHGGSRLGFASVTDVMLFLSKSDKKPFHRRSLDDTQAYIGSPTLPGRGSLRRRRRASIAPNRARIPRLESLSLEPLFAGQRPTCRGSLRPFLKKATRHMKGRQEKLP
jgi:hypothetical protein